MVNQTVKFREGKIERGEVLWVVSCSPNVTTSAGHSGPAAQPAQGRWLPHPFAVGLLAKATEVCTCGERTLPGSKVVTVLRGRKPSGFTKPRIRYSKGLKSGTQQGQSGHKKVTTKGCRQEQVRIRKQGPPVSCSMQGSKVNRIRVSEQGPILQRKDEMVLRGNKHCNWPVCGLLLVV